MKFVTILFVGAIFFVTIFCVTPTWQATVSYNVINDNLEQLGMQCYDSTLEIMDFSYTGADPYANGAATVGLTVFGDFDAAGLAESIGVVCEGFDFGRFLDGNPNNDLWSDVNGDFGNQCGSSVSTTATVPLANLLNIVGDGVIACSISIGTDVNCFCGQTFVRLSFTYSVQPASVTENFESFNCGTRPGSFPILGGFGTVQSSFPYILGNCGSWSLCYANAITRDNRALGYDYLTGGGITIDFNVAVDFFSGYFASCRTGCCTDVVSFTFFRQGSPVITASLITGDTGGALVNFAQTGCFDRVVITGNFLVMDDLQVRVSPPVVTCPATYPQKLFERFEGFSSCGAQSTTMSIFSGFATLSDSVPYIWGSSCGTPFSLCYALGVANGARSFGHDGSLGSTTITFNRPVYGFGGNFASCQGGCCSDSITFQYYISGNTVVFSETVSFGASGGVMRPYARDLSEFDKVVITGKAFIMDDIYYITLPPKYTPTDQDLCTATIAFPNFQPNSCRPSTFSSTNPSGSVFPIGLTWVTNTLNDGLASATCTFAVRVRDEQSPSLTCPSSGVIFTTADPGFCSATGVTYNVPILDNCGIQTSSVVPSSPSSFPVGSTAVLATATDIYGNFAQCDFTVNVRDTQPPVITCPANVVVNAPNNECSAIVNFPSASVVENCAQGLVLSSSVQPGFDFPVGTTVVTYTATDAAGLFSSCTFNVIVNDISKRCLCGNGNVDVGSGEQCEVNQLGAATCASKINPATGQPFYPDGGILDCTLCQYDYSRCAVCGDGRIDGTEQCDSSNLNQQTCSTQGFTTGTLQCSNTCRFVTTGCSTCGDGVRQGTEQCDGSDLNGKTCLSVLGAGASGTLSCKSDCTFNTLLCVAPKVTAPDGSKIQYMTLGIAVSATGFTGDRKAVISMTDGTLTQTFPEVSLSQPAGSLTATIRPTILRASTQWRVFVKGTTTQIQAQSVLFTVKNSP